MLLPAPAFQDLVRNAPLLAVDFLVSNTLGSVLLGRRRNPPAAGSWCVPGGRVRKNETLAAAVARKLREELGIETVPELEFRGVYEHFFSDSSFDQNVATHYVALVFAFTISAEMVIRACPQHEEFRFFTREEVMERPDVPQEVKAYLEGNFLSHLNLAI